MTPALFAVRKAGEHPTQLLDSIGPFDLAYIGAPSGPLDDEVAVGKGGYLRQVSDAQDLAVPGEVGHLATDGESGGAADACVDFVEDDDGGITCATCDAQRQNEPAQLAT